MRIFALVLLLALAGCAGMEAGSCTPGTGEKRVAQLFFGRAIGTTLGVSDADWQSFVDGEVAPRFPDGFTVIDATGQWHGNDGAIVREPSKEVMIVHSGALDDDTKLAAIREAYKTRFHQDAVMLIETKSCVGF